LFALDEHSFDWGTTLTFVTDHGFLDVALLPNGPGANNNLRRDARREQITENLQVEVTSLADIIRSKEATAREKDRAVLPVLRQVLERSRSMEHPVAQARVLKDLVASHGGSSDLSGLR
jgi:hypothetical protein